jgi:hypothetical protein
VKTVIIQSIGTANPGTAKVMADSFGISHELFLKLLYNAPAVFLDKIEDAVADKTADLLRRLGLEITCQDADEPQPEKAEPLDVAVYVNNPLELTKVAGQLAVFIGCKESEALQLLLNEPSVVLGGVSLATAKALQSRLSAEVITSNPRADHYTLEVLSIEPLLLNQFTASLKNMGLAFDSANSKMISDLTYRQAQDIWNKYTHVAQLQIYNQSYRRYNIELNGFNPEDAEQTAFLISQVGMPAEILEEVHSNLPVLLDESVSINTMLARLEAYNRAGLRCAAVPLPFGKYKLSVNNIVDKKQVQEIVSQFYKDTVIPNAAEEWTAPQPLNNVLNRYLQKQLEFIGCDVEHQYTEA